MKKKEKYFFVIYFKNEIIKNLLNTLRLVADPSQNNVAHLTVKGPYFSKQIKKLSEDKQLIEGKSIEITGVGNFFSEHQNTVFLKCENNIELKQIWQSKEIKTYKTFHPHITIYDGDDSDYATHLFNTLDSHHINLHLEVGNLELYSTKDKYSLLNLHHSVDYNLLSKTTGYNVTSQEIISLDENSRLNIIDKISEQLINVGQEPSAKTRF